MGLAPVRPAPLLLHMAGWAGGLVVVTRKEGPRLRGLDPGGRMCYSSHIRPADGGMQTGQEIE